MSTHASITAFLDNRYLSVYCHFDGYPEHVGNLLNEVYNTEDKIKELINMGDISSLADTIEASTFYCRDYNEDYEDVKPYDCFSLHDVKLENNQEYNYFWNGKKWKCTRKEI